MYARNDQGKELTFDFAEGLVKDNLLVVDRETSSVWSQLETRAISGPLKGHPLKTLPAIQTTWGLWLRLHPDTRVMTVPGRAGRLYHYRGSSPAAAKAAGGQDISAIGLGLAFGGEALYLPLTELAKAKTPFSVELDGRKLLIHAEPQAYTAWATDEKGELVVGYLAYQKGWKRFHLETKVFQAPKVPAKGAPKAAGGH